MIAEKIEKPDFLNLRWSEADDNILRELVGNGFTGTEIAHALGRTRSSILTRKFMLGIKTRIKRSKKGKASPLTYGVKKFHTGLKTKNPVAEMVEVLAKVSADSNSSKVKKKELVGKDLNPAGSGDGSSDKSDRGRLCQSAKLVHINRRLRRGDVTMVAQKTGYTVGFVSSVLAGTFPNEKIVNWTFNRLRGRKENSHYLDSKVIKVKKKKKKSETANNTNPGGTK
jgi:hypothetical protein